jgi:type II secretory pathway component PulJ
MKRARGFSLVELSVAMLFMALFGVIVHRCCAGLLRGVRVLEAASEAQEAARVGVQLIVADVREAGFSPTGWLHDGLRRAGATIVAIARDLNGNGTVDDASERVAYQFAADRRALLRAQGDAAAQPLLDGLDADGLRFTFLDAAGVEISAGAGELTADQRARVRRVVVRLAMAIPNPDPAATEPLRAEQTATAALRNPAP